MARSVIVHAVWLLAGLALLLSCRPTEPSLQRRSALSPPARAALDNWLKHDCALGQEAQLETDLRKFGRELERPLIVAFQEGPPAEELVPVMAAASQRFAEMREYLQKEIQQKGERTRLTPEQLGRVAAVTLSEHLNRAGAGYIAGYRGAALAGLSVIGGAEGRRLLTDIKADPKSPYQDIARLALEGER